MKFSLFYMVGILVMLSSNTPKRFNESVHQTITLYEKSIDTSPDTCIIEGLVFEMLEYEAPNPFCAKVKNGRIRIFDLQGQEMNYRVIRYVFSIRDDDQLSSVRHYGDLVSYPVLQILKDALIDETFYFEEIIIVDQSKEIQNNAVRPIIIKRIAN